MRSQSTKLSRTRAPLPSFKPTRKNLKKRAIEIIPARMVRRVRKLAKKRRLSCKLR
jgi:hypothetical protein